MQPGSPPESPKASLKVKLLLVFIPLLLCFGAAEFVLRWNIINDDERNILYRFDSELGWFPKEKLVTKYGGDYPMSVSQNSLGFRDREFLPKLKNRVAFVGDSFAWGFDSEVENRFDRILEKTMPNQEFVNLGVSGFGTDQELLLLRRFLVKVEPDLVYLFFHPNDRYTNTRNRVYNGYYKPIYKKSSQGNIEVHGVPVPMGLQYLKYKHPFFFRSNVVKYVSTRMLNVFSPEEVHPDLTTELLLEMRSFLESKNVALKIGIVGSYSDENIIGTLREARFDFKVIDTTGRDVDPHLFTNTGHWSIEGNQRAAKTIQLHLQE